MSNTKIDAEPNAAIAPRPTSKSAAVIELLRRPEGATLEQITAATGWKPHTARAALTGLKKKGHSVERTKEDGVSCYRITAEAGQ
jgi:DNA-binding IclR family transcriptional regulator